MVFTKDIWFISAKAESMKYIILLISLTALVSCDTKSELNITTETDNTNIDSIYITESITERIITRIALKGNNLATNTKVDSITIGQIQTKDGKQSYLTILRPTKDFKICIKSDSTIATNNIGDSLLNYLWKSNNEFIAKNSSIIFGSISSDSVAELFNNFRIVRKEKIDKHADKLTTEERELLHYQNDARVYSFLFYFGRIVKNYPPEDDFFQFSENINNDTNWAKTLPQNLLYKHEINYLTSFDSLTSMSSFINYMDSQTRNKDLLAFLKAIYISEIIESPSYWERHQKLFNSVILQQAIDHEKTNTYSELITKSAHSFFSSQKGVKAYNFTAERIDGSQIRLNELRGKIVFIDSWATWCGPCIAHRPRVLELAKKYENESRVEILMISMDASKDVWSKFLSKMNQHGNSGDLIIENGMRTMYGDKFNVQSIPKYILIDQFGVIIKSDIAAPSKAVEDMIERELSKM